MGASPACAAGCGGGGGGLDSGLGWFRPPANDPAPLAVVHHDHDEFVPESCFDLLPKDCRVLVFEHLTLDELDEASPASRRFCAYCRHPSLPLGRAMQDPTAVVRVVATATATVMAAAGGEGEGASIHPLVRVVRRWAAMAGDESARSVKFERFRRLKILDAGRMAEGDPSRLDGLYSRRNRLAPIPQVTSLDMSNEPGSGLEPVEHNAERLMAEFIPWMLPNLRALDVSFWSLRISSLRGLSERCTGLERLTWRGHHLGEGLSGFLLSRFPNIREVDMDSACFNGGGQVYSVSLLYDEQFEEFLFWRICDRVERVSLRGARYTHKGIEPTSIPQEGLVKFVRRAPNLRWFRSDLTPSNVEMLRRELSERGRPEIAFEP
jgi:hypothetical protein